jgi:hypothetical protein
MLSATRSLKVNADGAAETDFSGAVVAATSTDGVDCRS